MTFKQWYERTGWKLTPARPNQPPSIYIDVPGGTRVHLNAARAEQIWHAAKDDQREEDANIATTKTHEIDDTSKQYKALLSRNDQLQKALDSISNFTEFQSIRILPGPIVMVDIYYAYGSGGSGVRYARAKHPDLFVAIAECIKSVEIWKRNNVV